MTLDPSRPVAFFMTDASRGTTPAHVTTLPVRTGVIFRDYAHADRATLGQSYRDACRRHGLPFFVAGSIELANALGADGLHLPEHRIDEAKDLPFKGGLVSAACHTQAAILQAARSGVDMAIASPIFPTESHPSATTLGIEGLLALLNASPIPVYALGGINSETIKQLPTHPQLAGVAAIGMFINKIKT